MDLTADAVPSPDTHPQDPKEAMTTALSPAAQSFLERQPNLILGTIRKDGSPQASPLWYLWTGSSFLISTVDTTAKWANLQRDPRCSVCVDDPTTGQMIVAYGRAELKSDDVEDKTRALLDKYYPGDPERTEDHMKRIFDGSSKRVLIDVVPDEIITRKLD